MNQNLRVVLPLIVSIPLLLYMIFVLRRIYIYHHPPKELGNLYCFCSFSIRKRQSMLLFGMLLLFSVYENIFVRRIEYILLSIVAVILLLHSFSRDRIFENGISYNDIYIFYNEIKEIVYERDRGEYWIKTCFNISFLPMQITTKSHLFRNPFLFSLKTKIFQAMYFLHLVLHI